MLIVPSYLVRDRDRTNSVRSEAQIADATTQCLIAARKCINASELVGDVIPPSHWLAICVHCLTLAGVAL
jgi:hypothetical protein